MIPHDDFAPIKFTVHNADVCADRPLWFSMGFDGIIQAVGWGEAPRFALSVPEVLDACGLLLMPGCIDCHVHMREPGLTHKADIDSETRAALAGGVTSVIDMPNTVPQTVTIDAWNNKMDRAAATAHTNYAFFVGATSSNLEELEKLDPTRVPGVKLFMGSSTGNMLVDGEDALDAIFALCGRRHLIVCVHAEDEQVIARERKRVRAEYGDSPVPVCEHSRMRPVEACVRATQRAIALAERHHAHLHLAHITTAAEVDHITEARKRGVRVTCEVSPHHLLFCQDDYARLGSRIKMNPAVKSAADRDALRRAAADGRIDMVATDHAPHLLAEKEGDAFKAMSGAPMVQFALPALLEIFKPSTVARLYSTAPAGIYGIKSRGYIAPGCFGDFVLVERLKEPMVIEDADVVSKCGWTPLAGQALHHRVVHTFINGGLAPQPLRFNPS